VLAKQSLDDARRFLELDEVFTQPVRTNQRFRDAFETATRDLAAYGPIDSIALRTIDSRSRRGVLDRQRLQVHAGRGASLPASALTAG
jgi:hypothetical protein